MHGHTVSCHTTHNTTHTQHTHTRTHTYTHTTHTQHTHTHTHTHTTHTAIFRPSYTTSFHSVFTPFQMRTHTRFSDHLTPLHSIQYSLLSRCAHTHDFQTILHHFIPFSIHSFPDAHTHTSAQSVSILICST